MENVIKDIMYVRSWHGNCYGCGKSGHMNRDFPMMMSEGREILYLNQVPQIWILIRRTTSMLSNPEVIRRTHHMW